MEESISNNVMLMRNAVLLNMQCVYMHCEVHIVTNAWTEEYNYINCGLQ